MSVFISEALALALAATDNADYPLALYDSVVTIDNIAATSEETDYPATNLANPSTTPQQGWRSDSLGVQYLTVTIGSTDPVSEYGVARHNWGSGLIGFTPEILSADDGVTWTAMDDERFVANDDPIIGRIVATTGLGFRLKLRPTASTKPRACVLYVGEALVFERGVQVHTAINHGRKRNVVTGRSHSGDYLGRIVTGSTLQTQADINYLTPEFYRAEVDPFFAASAETPFFFAWSPQSYPLEVGYAWLTSDPVPQTAHLAGYINVSLQMEGIA